LLRVRCRIKMGVMFVIVAVCALWAARVLRGSGGCFRSGSRARGGGCGGMGVGSFRVRAGTVGPALPARAAWALRCRAAVP
jgi:hypothetical protein